MARARSDTTLRVVWHRPAFDPCLTGAPSVRALRGLCAHSVCTLRVLCVCSAPSLSVLGDSSALDLGVRMVRLQQHHRKPRCSFCSALAGVRLIS